MNERPELNCNIDVKTFREYYYLKEELTVFCRKNNLQTTGSKEELTERIAVFLEKGEKIRTSHSRKVRNISEITLDTVIEDNFVCSEKHRAFFPSYASVKNTVFPV